jgi:hypothetical protein
MNPPEIRLCYIVRRFIMERSRGGIVGIATGYGLGDRGVGVRVPVGSTISSQSSRPALGSTQPPIQWVPGVKQEGREAGHSPRASAQVKKKYGSIHPLPHTLSWHRA